MHDENLTHAHESSIESLHCDSAPNDAGGRCSSSSLAHTQGEPGAEPGPATTLRKEIDTTYPTQCKRIGFEDKESIGTFAFFNAAFDWADLNGMDLILVRDEREWCAIVRLHDTNGPFQVEIEPCLPYTKSRRPELYNEYCIRVDAHIRKAIQKRREERIRQYTKANPAGVRDPRQIDLEEIIAEAKRRAGE
jgi:hypothetical protein